MNNGFKENYQWLTLISVAVIYTYYFIRVLPAAGPDITGEQVALFVAMVVLLVAIHLIGAILLIAVDRFREPETDERDLLIDLKARRNESWVLSLGIFAGISVAFFLPGNFWVMHTLLASLVLTQVVESATVIFYYRRGF